MEKELNYSPEITEDIKKTYQLNPTRATVEELAKKYNRSIRSIVGKLSKEGVYKRPSYVTKRGEIPVSKDNIVEMIAQAIDVPSEQLDGLEKAPKLALRLILNALDPKSNEHFIPKV